MRIDWKEIEEGKRAFRRGLAARPIGEKLALLDALRERSLVLRRTQGPVAGEESGAPEGTAGGQAAKTPR
jgi:hypothetical protein